ncbi:MAG: HAMP domain-containing histidine kinase [Magnetococcales bacterium]|nr:HAMP domain-containing histidine kinase [Magnetococcales bacterium]MBF0151346.1 HAMP domain-containing histidine kinase [Magnetococcales bacterium]
MRLLLELPSRVAFAFACFGGVISLVLCVGIYFFVLDIEKRIVDRNLNDEIQDYMDRRARNPFSLPQKTVTMIGYVHPPRQSDPPVPPELVDLQPGFHDLMLENISYRVLVRHRAGERFVILYNNMLVRRQRELHLLVVLVLGGLTVTLLATLGGYWVTDRVISPVSELARRVQSMGETAPGSLLAPHFSQDAVGDLARVLSLRQDQILGFLERERAFATDVSHELRNPLAIIQGAADVLRELFPVIQEAKPLQRIVRAVGDMNVLTSALLLLSRGERGDRQTHATCHVAVVIKEVIEQNRFLLRNKEAQLQLIVDAQPVLNTECVFVQIVAGNLVRNACTYIHRGLVRVHLQERELTVSDTGSGIDPAILEKLFHARLTRSESRGSGVGLTLVKRICDRHQWQITIESQEHQGTVARFIFKPESEKLTSSS